MLHAFRPGGGEERIPQSGQPRGGRAVQASRASARRRAASAFSCAARRSAGARRSPAPPRSSRRSRAGRSGGRSPTAISRRRWPSTRTAQGDGDFDTAIRDGAADHPGEPEVPVPRRAAAPARQRAPGTVLSHHRSRPRVAARRSSSRAGRRTMSCSTSAEKGRLADAQGARRAGPAAAGRLRGRSRSSPASRSSG